MRQLANLKTHSVRLSAILVFAILFFLAGCGHLKNLKSAQTKFNQCAEQDNLWVFKAEADGYEVRTPPSLCYDAAYSDVKKALKNPGALRKDDVLANAYKIKALCEWRLKMYDAAQESANEAVKEYLVMEGRGIAMPRDLMLMKVLPNLIEIDKAKDSLTAFTATEMPSFKNCRNYYLENIFNSEGNKAGKLQLAIQKINKIRDAPNGNPDLGGYLIQAQLAGLKSWANSIEKLLFESAKADTSLSDAGKKEALKFWPTQRTALEKQKKELLEALIKLKPLGKDDPLVKFWDDLI